MKIVVVSLNRQFDKLKTKIKKTATKLARLLRLGGYYLEIYLVGDKFMKNNVLAFPAPKDFPRPDIRGKSLGEIYLNPNLMAKGQLPFMLVHGFLHLMDYDHKRKSDTIIMEKKEQELLKLLGWQTSFWV